MIDAARLAARRRKHVLDRVIRRLDAVAAHPLDDGERAVGPVASCAVARNGGDGRIVDALLLATWQGIGALEQRINY